MFLKTKGIYQIRKVISFLLVWLFLFSVILVSMPQNVEAAAAIPAYLNPTASVEDRVADLLGRMNLDEKVGQMLQPEKGNITTEDVKNYYLGSVLSGGGSFPGDGTENDSTMEKWAALYTSMQDAALSTRLGIPILYGADAVHGHSNVKGATIFPHNIGLGAARDTDLVERIGAAAAEEIKATGVNWAFAPTIADPQNEKWGRTYEGFSENLDLVAQMGVAYTKGLQGASISDLKKADKVVATVKHFIGEGWTDNGTNQGNVTSLTREQLAEQLMKPYADAVAAGVRSVMVSYSSINGVKCHASKYLITDVLKGQLGFDGIVITDYNGVEQISRDETGNSVSGLKGQLKVGINAGIDMLMETGNWKNCINYIKELIAEESAAPGSGIPMSRINDAVSRILRVKFQTGVYENSKPDGSLASKFGSQENRDIAREAVRKSLVLLKNDEVNDAPILSQLKNMDNIFVAGANADNLGNQCGGWTITWQGKSGNTLTTGTTILKGIQDALLGTGKTVAYNRSGRVPEGADAAIVVVGETPYAEGEGDAANLELSADDKATLANVKAAGVPTIVILVSGRPMIINDYLNDWDGLIAAWLPGTEGQGVADVLFGDCDFSGKLPIKWPFYLEALPIHDQESSPYVLFKYGYGLKKNEATPILPAVPEKPKGQLPVGVTPIDIPTNRVEAENPYTVSGWDLNMPGNNFIETGEGRSGGKNIGWTSAGKWLKYFVNAAQPGWYQVELGLASPGGASNAIQLRDGDGNVLCTASAPNTGSWSAFAPATAYVQLPFTGEQVIQFYCAGGNFNFDYMQFAKIDAPPVTPPPPPFVETAPVLAAGVVESWMSTEKMPGDGLWYWKNQYDGGERKLEKQANLNITKEDDSDITTIRIDPSQQFQEMMGIGISMEEATVYNLRKMSQALQEEFLQKLVGSNGAEISMIRVCIGTPDFTARTFYTYDDMPKGQTDEDFSEFSIQKDKEYGIIDTLKRIREIKPDIKFFASPWSPPGWMKTSDSIIRGQVKDEYLDELAEYYLKFLQAYKAEGIDIEAMTLQNEPLLEIDYPSAKLTWQQEAHLAKLLRAELDSNGFNHVKLWIFDHNPGDTMTYPAQILKDNGEGAYDAVDGTAFHDYGGDLSEMTRLHNLYPEKNVYLTERSVWGTTGADRMAQYFRNWAKSYNAWVTMLDSDIATHQWVGTPGPTMLIQDAGNRENYWETPEYYITGQYTKFVKPGFVRIYSDYGSSGTVTNVAFLDPQTGKITTVVINQSSTDQVFRMLCNGTQIATTIPAKTVATYVWMPVDAPDGGPGTDESEVVDYTPSSVIALQAGADATNASNWNRADDGKLKEGAVGGYADYIVNVPVAGDYAIDFKYNGAGTRTVQIDYGTGSSVSIPAPASSSSNQWEPWNAKSIRRIVHLEAGSQSIRLNLAAQDGWTDVVSLTFTKLQDLVVPARIDAVQAYDYSSLAIDSTNDPGSGKYFGNTSAGSWMAYKVNVNKGGEYDISYRVASGNDNARIKLKVNEDEAISPEAVLVPKTDWNTYTTVTDRVYLPAGTVTLAVYCDTSGYNFNWFSIAFPDVEETPSSVITLRAGADATNASNWTQTDDGKLKNGSVGSYADYTVNGPEAGDYAIDFKYNGPGTRIVQINYGTDSSVTIDAPASSAWEPWHPWNAKSVRRIIHLEAGTQSIKMSLLAQSEWTDVVSLTFTKLQNPTVPAKIDAVQAYDYSSLAVDSTNDPGSGTYFGNTSAGSWMAYKVNINKGGEYDISYRVASGNDNARIKLKVNENDAISPEAVPVPKTDWNTYTTVTDRVYLPAGTVTLAMYCDISGFNFNWFSIQPLKVQPTIEAALGYSFNGRIISAAIGKGIFVKSQVNEITLNGQSLPVAYLDPTHVRIALGWDYVLKDGDTLTVIVPTTAYADSTGGSSLTDTITVSNAVNKFDAVAIPGKINAEDYYQMDGLTLADCSLGGKQLDFGDNGGWVDYYVNAAEEGDYTINLKINPKNALGGVVQLMEGTDVLCTFNTPSVDSKWVDLRRTVRVTAGMHHLKLFATSGRFSINWLEFVPKVSQSIVDGAGNPVDIQAESYFNSDQVPVEGNQNLGYVAAGNYMDYFINVPKTADYTVTYRYTTAQSGVSVSFLDVAGNNAAELCRTSLPGTGGWSNYATAKGAVHLTAGEHTIRLVDNGDGANFDSFKLIEGVGPDASVLTRAATPVASLKSGVYNGGQTVTLSCATSGVTYYYTLDGSLPTKSSISTAGTIVISTTAVLRVIAVKDGMADSYVAPFTYVINTASELITALIDQINSEKIDIGVQSLENALKSLNKGNYTPAENQMDAFINQVEAKRGKGLTKEKAEEMISKARLIIGVIDCDSHLGQ
jgi:beta-glucosidase